MPEGYTEAYGFPISVLIVISIVTIAMTIIAKQNALWTLHLFAMGGNPDAAELSGINTRLLTVKGLRTSWVRLTAIAAVDCLGTAWALLAIIWVTLDELRVIAAAVIGGTALAGWRRYDLRRDPRCA